MPNRRTNKGRLLDSLEATVAFLYVVGHEVKLSIQGAYYRLANIPYATYCHDLRELHRLDRPNPKK